MNRKVLFTFVILLLVITWFFYYGQPQTNTNTNPTISTSESKDIQGKVATFQNITAKELNDLLASDKVNGSDLTIRWIKR